jgi:hypothetical protein
MNENVITAFVRLNKSEALLTIEPLHGSRLHRINPRLDVRG